MHRRTGGLFLTMAAVGAVSIGLSGQAARTFVPDWTFKGSALSGAQQVGQATWRAENGEIIGTPTGPDGGWLLLESGYQDVQVAASYKCAGECTAGIMVRSEKGARCDQGRLHGHLR